MPDGARAMTVQTQRVTLGREDDVLLWCQRLHCTEAQLHRAVKAVGSNLAQVEAHLARKYGAAR